MSVSAEADCFVCGKGLSDGEVVLVKERGVNSIRNASVKRGITSHQSLLKNLTEIAVHVPCQKNYTNEKLILAFLRRGEKSAQTRSLRSNGPKFEFKTKCFICAEKITSEYLERQKKLPISRRDSVHKVELLSVNKTIIKAAEERGDEWAQKVIERIALVPEGSDLVAQHARYHGSCYKKLFYVPPSRLKPGQYPRGDIDIAMEDIYKYLLKNSDECQFTLEQLISQIQGDFRPDIRTVKTRLESHYSDDILFVERGKHTPVVCFKNTGYKIITNQWYQDRSSNPMDERLRIVRAAADIIREDIRSKVYSFENYSPSDDFFQDVNTVIPRTVTEFYERVIGKGKNGKAEGWKRKCDALSHALISAARPRSFVSSLLTGVGAYMYKKFGSKKLIDVLSALGFSCSYKEATRLEQSAILHPEIPIQDNAFMQFVFDNADFNIDTLDGCGTFHTMGGIVAVTPATSVGPDRNIQRVQRLSSTELVGKFGSVPLKSFHGAHNSGLQNIRVEDVAQIHPLSEDILPSAANIIWLYGKWSKFSPLPGWNGFMEKITSEQNYEMSKILCLPFINSAPTHYDTVLTSLEIASKKSRSHNQQTTFVSFDQQLYIKGRDILASGLFLTLKNVIVRLGGFHLLMSFMGCIGFIMAGSGLKELFATIYAENSIEKILSGHAYSRAVRGHMLVHRALSCLMFESVQFSPEERKAMEEMLLSQDKNVILNPYDNKDFQSVRSKLIDVLNVFKENGPTSQLWVQYLQMTTLIELYIEAERTGNWELHLVTVQKMIPFFHAAAHFNYAKSAHLYLQDMLTLKEKMTSIEYERFTKEGYFTIRRSHKFWSGIWSDMTIEQTLMRSMKTSGGLTRGRGITDSSIVRWTAGFVYLHNICEGIESFCGVTSGTSEQHVEMRPTRIKRDDKDVQSLVDWFACHEPFPKTNVIMSISNGTVGDNKVTCHMAEKMGKIAMSKIVDLNFGDLHLKRKDAVVSIAAMSSSVKNQGMPVAIDPLMLFHRMCIAKKSESELKEYFQYELSPVPLSFFSEEGMRKGTKSLFYSSFNPLPNDRELGSSKIHVIDGGYLLHKVVWGRAQPFSEIFQQYVRYIQNHYGTNVIVVFDGYPESENLKSTKRMERARRARVTTSAEVLFSDYMHPQVPQEKFLGNEKNKSRFISLLRTVFEQSHITTIQAEEDADVLIVTTANSLSTQHDAVIIIGEDVDLLVLLTALSPPNVYFLKVGKGKSPSALYSNKCFKYIEIVDNILFIHAISGCDTTGAPFGQGKFKFCNVLLKNPSVNELVRVFQDPKAKRETITLAAEQVFALLYGGSEKSHLENLRYTLFAKGVKNNKFNLCRLPPTKDAVHQHALRTYLQVQTWLDHDKKNPTEWGWRYDAVGLLTPVPMLKEAAPQALLNFISCQCKKGCAGKCTCRKSGLKCSVLCIHCNGNSCENAVEDFDDDDEEFVPPVAIDSADATEKDYVENIQGPSKRQKL